MRRMVLALVLCLTVAVVSASSAAGSPRTACPNGFDTYPVPTQASHLQAFPRIVDGLLARAYTADELITLAAAINGNGDRWFCLKAVSNLRGESVKSWAYFYGARDNDAAAS